MARAKDLDSSVRLPPGLARDDIRRAIDCIEKRVGDFTDLYFEHANGLSALVGIFGTKALDSVSNYEKHCHAHTAQQRFPDLRRRGSGANPSPNESLESKGSKRAWAIQ